MQRYLTPWRQLLLCSLAVFFLSGCAFLEELTTEPTWDDRPSPSRRAPDGPATSSPRGWEREARLRSDIVDFAEEHIGARYKSAGTSPRSGFDCSGFTSYVMSEFDVRLSRSSDGQADDGRTVSVNSVQPGDLVFFKRSKTGPVFHVALVVENGRRGIEVVHSTTSRGVIRENITQSSYWRPKIWQARDVIRSGR